MRINKTTILSCLSFLLLTMATIGAFAQDPLQAKDSIYSNILQEERKIDILYPKGYNPAGNTRYEVLYCLEGIPGFARTQYNLLNNEGFIPDLILVGLPNTIKNGTDMRDRDFTPTHTYGETGGADKFLAFLKTELLPYIQQHYPVKSSGHSLYGGSLSGLLAVYAFLKEPALFTSYIAVDPSLWWDDFYLCRSFDQFTPNLGHLQNSLWLAGREGSPFHFMGLAKMDSLLSVKKLAGLSWKRQLYYNETHYSTQFKGLWDGLKFSYGGFYASPHGYLSSRQLLIKPQGGLILKGKPFNLVCSNLADSPYVHYTTDGSVPTAMSPSLSGEQTRLTLHKSTLIRYKSIGVRPEYNREDSAFFELGGVIRAVTPPAGIQPGGLQYRYYEGSWTTLPDLTTLTPVRSGNTGQQFDLSALPPQTGYALAMEGYIKIEKAGYYIFEQSGKDFRMFLNNRQYLGKHITNIGEFYMVPLDKGYHALRIEYLHIKGTDNPQPLYIKPEDADDFPVPLNMLYAGSK
ncbi:alpha/beta hydrolase-fold protein [Chitinophaga sp. Cy-1792]|uniref:alpha/beta hydrolase-fold protein n=1 Tax=Chitinophaga sp. Cy-1792 TaxID=2608339 RepID=UPI001421C655|nr:alpha/beta hydrolase-fold protein [Chitinophaga sp. Cy-1792]